MNTNHDFDELVGLIYEAALEPEHWQAVLLQLSDLFNSAGTSMWVHDAEHIGNHPHSNGQILRAVRFDSHSLASYANYYVQTNVWAQNEEQRQEGSLLTSSMQLADNLLPKTEYYADWLRPQDLFYSIGAVVLKNGSLSVKLSALRSRRHGDYTEDDLGNFRRLLPHIQRACKINQRLLNERLLAESRTQLGNFAQEIAGLSMLGLSDGGQLLYANRCGEAAIRDGQWLTVQQGGLRAADGGKDAELQQALRECLRQNRPQHINLGGNKELAHCCMTVMPAPPWHQLSLTDQRIAILVVVSSRTERRIATGRQLMDLFGLTPAESRLLRALVQGEDLEQYAKAEDLKKSTVRSQLQAVMMKTGVGKQKDLVKLVLSIPAVRDS